MKNPWRRVRVVVEIPVQGDLTESEFRWCVESALTSSSTLDGVLHRRHYWKNMRYGRLLVKMWSRVFAKARVMRVVREEMRNVLVE